jgi:hypothetical protein
MSLSKPFSQCSLSDLAPVISAHAKAASALDPAAAGRLLPALRNAALTEAVLLCHPLVRDRSGLKCDGSACSKRAWCGMLRDLVAAAGVDVSDAALLRVYLVCKECAKLERAQFCSSSPASAAAEDGASSSLTAARAPPLTFTYHDRFLGKAVCIPIRSCSSSKSPPHSCWSRPRCTLHAAVRWQAPRASTPRHPSAAR